MNEGQIIEAALRRRFARAAVPECPQGPWSPTTAAPVRPHHRSRGFAYAIAVLGVLVSAGVAAQASGVLRAGYAHLFTFQGSTKPLPPLTHRADRLTIAQAQQHMPFAIVVPAGLPPHTILQYAGVGSAAFPGSPIPRVALNYQSQIGGRYYRIIIIETTVVSGLPVAHFEAIGKGKDGRLRRETWTVPLRRWKHGDVIMTMLAPGIPATMIDRIVRENTL
jgi:hypothetical protein